MLVEIVQTENFTIQYDDAAFTQQQIPLVKARGVAMAPESENDLKTLCALYGVAEAQKFGSQNRIFITLNDVRGAVNSGYSQHNSQMQVNPELGAALDFVMLLFVDEMSEILMDILGGWGPGNSGGEGLSRVSGALLHPASAPVNVNAWLFFDPTKDPTAAVADDAFRKDWVSQNFTGGPLKAGGNVAGDQDSYSVGCSILYLNYLRSQLDFSLNDIIAQMPIAVKVTDPTLANVYKQLSFAAVPAYAQFRRFIDSHFSDNAGQLTTNNPFPLAVTHASAASAGTDKDLFVFISMVDGTIAYNSAAAGEAFHGWREIPGSPLTSTTLATGVLGPTVYLFARGPANDVLFTKTEDGSTFAPWAVVPGGVNIISGVAAAGRPSELFLVANTLDGRILFNQIVPNGGFVGWQEIPGGLRTTTAVAAGMQNETLFIFALGTDGKLHFNQAAPGGAFVGWQAMANAPLTVLPPATSGRMSDLFIFVVGEDGQIHFNQAAPGGEFVGWQAMPGDRRTPMAVGTGMRGGKLFVFSTEPNGRIVFNQAPQGGAFVGWQLLR